MSEKDCKEVLEMMRRTRSIMCKSILTIATVFAIWYATDRFWAIYSSTLIQNPEYHYIERYISALPILDLIYLVLSTCAVIIVILYCYYRISIKITKRYKIKEPWIW